MVRWDRFFDDLEDQLASEWEAERAALDTEAERLRLSRVTLRERLNALAERDRASSAPSFELIDGTVLKAEVSAVGADWVGLEPAGGFSDSGHSVVPGAVIAPIGAICAIGMPHPDLLRSARPAASRPTGLSDRMTLGFVLRDLVRRRTAVAIHITGGRVLTGTIDRAGADHLDLALHEPGSPRRADAVTGYRVVPFTAIVWLRLEGPANF